MKYGAKDTYYLRWLKAKGTYNREEILKRDGYKCKYCGHKRKLQIDHIIPISRGGNHYPENLQTLCLSCNRRKSAKLPRSKGERIFFLLTSSYKDSGLTDVKGSSSITA